MKQLNKTAFAIPMSVGLTLNSITAFAQSSYSSRQAEDSTETLVFFIVIIVGLLLYFIPSIAAFRKHHPNRWPILLINTVFGGTGLGWIGSLIWAMSAVHVSETGTNGGESGLNIFANDPVHVKLDPDILPSQDTSKAGEQLTQIKNLFEQNAITQEEYDRLRKPLIAQLTGDKNRS